MVIAGGFTSTSHLLIGITNILGLFCVWFGIAGVVRSNKEYVYLFFLYQVWHLLACLGATLLDAKVFWHCDSFITDYASAVEQFGFTPVMYDLALENDCNLYRSVFLYCSVFSFFLWSYAIYFTMTLYGVLARDDRLENFTHRLIEKYFIKFTEYILCLLYYFRWLLRNCWTFSCPTSSNQNVLRFFRSTAVRVGTKEDADLMTP